MNLTEAIKSRILELCEENDLTIQRLAEKASLAPSSIKNILYGKSKNPTINSIEALCDGIGITLGEFFSTPEFEYLEKEIKKD